MGSNVVIKCAKTLTLTCINMMVTIVCSSNFHTVDWSIHYMQ